MAGNVPGEFGVKKKPATLDLSGIITRVEWAVGPSILMLHFEAQSSFHPPNVINLSALGLGTIPDVFAQTINEHDAFVPVPNPVNPMTKEMVAHTIAWNRAPKKTSNSDSGFVWKGVLFLNLGRIKSFFDIKDFEHYEITIHFPESTKTHTDGFILYAFADTFGWDYAFAHPQTTGAIIDSFGHTAIVITPMAFGSEALRSEFLSFNAGALPPWVAHDEPASGELFDLFRWDLKAYTFKRRKDFPLKDNLDPDFAADATRKDFKQDSAHATVDVQIPAYTVKITVNMKTLKMTMGKV